IVDSAGCLVEFCELRDLDRSLPIAAGCGKLSLDGANLHHARRSLSQRRGKRKALTKICGYSTQASVPVLTFVSYRGGHFYECQNQKDTSKFISLVWPFVFIIADCKCG